MCQIDDELTTREAVLIVENPLMPVRTPPGWDKFIDAPNWQPLYFLPEDYDEDVFRAYLDGLLALPFETLAIIQEMEQEKRGER